MSEHKMKQGIDGFHLYSYYAGITFAFAEVVSAGCKRLALSSPYTDDELDALLEPTQTIAKEFGLPIYVEKDFLTTKLFDPAFTEGKNVVLIAQSQKVIDDYLALKKLKGEAMAGGKLAEIEDELAWRFGRLLSYSDEAITELLRR